MEYIKTFENFLFEIGDASAKVYKYEYVDGSTDLSSLNDKVEARFTSDSGLDYVLTIINIMKFADVSFSINGEYPETNRGEVFRIMSTVSTILQEVLSKNDDIRGIRYDPQGKGDDLGKGRDKLYRAFIENSTKKLGKGVKFMQQGGTVFAMFS